MPGWPPYYRSEHWLPFDTRIGYIGMSEVIDSKGLRYEGTDHSGIHHNKKVINSVKYILNN